jgi:hypothetical protein
MWDQGGTVIDGKPLFTEETVVEWEKFMILVGDGYFSDPLDFPMHIKVSKPDAAVAVYITKRGNSPLEGYVRNTCYILMFNLGSKEV